MAYVLWGDKLWDENFGPIFCRMNRWADSRGEDPSELIRVGMLSDMGLFWVLTSALSLPFAPDLSRRDQRHLRVGVLASGTC